MIRLLYLLEVKRTMATGRMEFHSQELMLHSNFSFVLPNDVEMEEVFDTKYYERDPMNLILLHGLTGTDTDWVYGGVAQLMAIQYNLNIFMPTTGNSFYLDKGYAGRNHASFIAEELPDYIHKTFGIEFRRDNTMIGGLSMGGYGSIHTAFTYPEKFCACIALSSAMVIKDVATRENADVSSVLPAGMKAEIFGDLSKLLESDKNPEVLYKTAKAKTGELPFLYFAVGTEDNLLESNRRLRDFLKAEGADFFYEEGPGRHTWQFWNEYIDRGLKQVLNR